VVAGFLLEPGTLVDKQRPDGATALRTACYHNRSDVAEVLLQGGASVDVRSSGTYPAFDEVASEEWCGHRLGKLLIDYCV
jgi:ankyrin repeat protein